MPFAAGEHLGPYELLGLLGAGGMGEVYRARDTRLDRVVALKVLPPAFAADADRRQRFAREAKAIAALNHPHICTLYAFEHVASGEGAEVDALVMEYLDGETLAARLQHGPSRRPSSGAHREASPAGPRPARALPLAEALALAIQIAEALAAAHKQGIVHRDLKPGNIMLTPGSGAGATAPQVKLLDFGLAKLRAAGGGGDDMVSGATATASEPLTGEGALVGTLAYMAPEQLEGQAVDARTDLFALGAIVYEMVTGQRAFEGDSQASLIAAILDREPPPLTARQPLAPPALERVVRKCLAKDPEARWESARDLADALRWIVEDSGVRARVSTPADPRPRRFPARAAAATVLAVAIGAPAAWWLRTPDAASPPMRTIPLTTFPGEEHDPAISPDGRQVAFTWRGPTGEGPLKLYVKLVDGGEPLLIHEGPGDVITPAWSPDGRRIAFLGHVEMAYDAPDTGLLVVSALGGTARQMDVFRSAHGLSWSPDGAHIAVSHRDRPEAPGAIYLFAVNTGERRRLIEPPSGIQGDFYPRFSPDGASLAFERRWAYFYSEICVTALTGGEVRRLTYNRSNLYGFDWMPDGQALVFSAARPGRPTSSGLWSVLLSGGEPTPLGVGEVAMFPAVAWGAERLVYEFGREGGDIWQVPGPAAAGEGSSPRPLIASTASDYSPAFSPDDRTVAFSSLRSGYSEIWVASADGSTPRQVTFLEQYSIAPRWSPDGRHLTFFSSADDTFDVYVVDESGGVPTRITNDRWNNVGPTWSRDGRWIYFRSDRSGRREAWKIPWVGGEPQQVTFEGANVSLESPDGRFLYFSKRGAASPGPLGIWRMPVGGGDEERVVPEGFHNLWAVLEDGLCYLTFDAGAPPTIKFFEFATGTTRQVAQVPGATINGLSVSSDGRSMVYTAAESRSDIMLVENFR